jgi:hypothetical protein
VLISSFLLLLKESCREEERARDGAMKEIAEKWVFRRYKSFLLKKKKILKKQKKILIIVRFSCVDFSSLGFLWIFDYRS